jgi:cytoskeletal protein RodZ
VGAFGEKFRRQREQRGLELDAISNTTKISTRMLRALEDEHFDQLPGGVFNKGFVRAYARQIGLDEEEAVADYLTALRESQIQQQSILPDFRPHAGKPAPVATPDLGSRQPRAAEPRNKIATSDDHAANNSDDSDVDDPELRSEERSSQSLPNEDRRNEDRRRTNIPKYPAGEPVQLADESSTPVPWGKLALTLVAVTLALALWNFRRHAQPAPASPAPAPSTAAASNQSPSPTSAPTPPATQPSGSTSSLSALPASPAATPPSGTSSPSVAAAAPLANSTTPPATAPARPLAASSAAALEASPDDEPTSVRRNIKPPALHAATPAATPTPRIILTLLIRAEKTTWISLTVDGKPITHETLIAPAHTSVRATREIVVRAGNAAGISFLLNGKEIPAQGSDGEVKTYVFDAAGVHVIPQTQPAATNHQP